MPSCLALTKGSIVLSLLKKSRYNADLVYTFQCTKNCLPDSITERLFRFDQLDQILDRMAYDYLDNSFGDIPDLAVNIVGCVMFGIVLIAHFGLGLYTQDW